MQRLPVAVAALFAAFPLFAQQPETPPAAAEMPNPRHPEHDLLKLVVGDWDVVFKTEAMPGVKGMEKATEARGTEHSELLCNGLFLKSVVDSNWQGKPSQGVWIAGYDPFKKHYTGICVSSDVEECGMSTMAGSYDAKTRTWSWHGSTPQGDVRSAFVFTDADSTHETVYMVGKDGTETKCMEITRRRAKTPRATDASAAVPSTPLAENKRLLADVGEWDATMHIEAGPGQPAMEEKCTESVRAICHGEWTWTDFKGQMMGMPFEGHALTGYDPNSKEYVSFWIDGMTPVAMQTTGTFDDSGNTANFTGATVDEQGQPMSVEQTMTRRGDASRALKMAFKRGDDTMRMNIDYRKRAAK